MKGSVAVRFWAKVQKGDGCWTWTGSTYSSGHGNFWAWGRITGAHRVSWMLHRGDIPPGLCVCHVCDNPSCVNPDHLFLGTQADNIADMVAKGRLKNPVAESQRARTHCPAGHEYAVHGRVRQLDTGRTARSCMECGRLRALGKYRENPLEGARRRRENRRRAERAL